LDLNEEVFPIHPPPSIHPNWCMGGHWFPIASPLGQMAFSEVGYEAVHDMLHTEKNL